MRVDGELPGLPFPRGGCRLATIDRRLLIKGTALLAGIALAPRGAAAVPSTRIAGLITRMTIEEKAGQLSCYNDEIRPVGALFNPIVNPRGGDAMLKDIAEGRIGMLFNGLGVAGARRAQAAALGGRLGIPLAFAADIIHGARTIFPIPLAEAAAFDPDLSERSARAIAREASAGGLHWTFAPMVDVARDQRWGRVAEGAGEDIHLGSLLAAARVRGFQGSDLAADDSLLATPKHFAGYGAVTGGMEYGAVDVSEDTLREVHMPPFAAAFAAGAGATIVSFTNMSGIPATANHRLLTDLLRGELRFTGVAVSDYDADRELIAHGFAADEADSARLAIMAGVDMCMQSGLYMRHLPALVARGAVPLARVDEAVGRVLALKQRLGLFDNPYRSLDARAERRSALDPSIITAARTAAQRSIVLLKNDAVLPLRRRDQRIALIGPFADDRAHLNGPWSFAGDATSGIDLAMGIRAALVDPSTLTVVRGSGIHDEVPGGMEAAVTAARAADIVLLAIGEGGDMSGEGNSRAEIIVPPAQQRLVEAVADAGKPVVVLLRHGRALALSGAVRDARAIVATWFLGSQTGHAVADVLFGRVDAVGRLPVSFPFLTGQQPWSYDRPSSGRPPRPAGEDQGGTAKWRDVPDAALYPFGHGLSYARFAMTDVVVPPTMSWNGALTISAMVRNISSVPGEAVVQLYIHDQVASRARPRALLKRFARVRLAPGETERVVLSLSRTDLLFVGDGGGWTVEPGRFSLSVGDGGVLTPLTRHFDLASG